MIKVHSKGLVEYQKIWDEMKSFTNKRKLDTPDELWLLEHKSVYTQGLSGKDEHLIKSTNIPIIHSDRGGQITYHGPGQLIIYCLIDINRLGIGVKKIISIIEQSIIEFLSSYDISAHTIQGAPGVYVNGSKIAALGFKVRHGRTYHGLSLNVDMDLAPYNSINPCGYRNLQITQMRELINRPLNIKDIKIELSNHIINYINRL